MDAAMPIAIAGPAITRPIPPKADPQRIVVYRADLNAAPLHLVPVINHCGPAPLCARGIVNSMSIPWIEVLSGDLRSGLLMVHRPMVESVGDVGGTFEEFAVVDDRLDRRVQHERMLFREQQLPLRAHVFGGILGRSRRRVVRSGDRLAEHACAIGLPLNARVAIDTGPQAFPGPRDATSTFFPVQVGISAWFCCRLGSPGIFG